MPGSFVGRAAEREAIRGLVRQAVRTRRPSVAVVVGEPGIGKTRLLSELDVSVDTCRQVRLSGYELEQDVPLACARELLRELSAVPDGEALGELAFGNQRTAAPVEQVRLFEAACRPVAALVPLVVLVDDLHWADDASLALFHYLVRAAETDRLSLVLLGAARPSRQTIGLLDSCRRVLGPDRSRCVELGSLSHEEGVRLARELDPTLDQLSADGLWQAAGGSPFWHELLAAGEDRDAGVATVVERRLGSLGPDSGSTLAAMSVVGRPLCVEDIAELQRWPIDRVEQAVEALERRGLLVRETAAIKVAHDLIRDAMLHNLSGAAVRRIHGRVGTWMVHTARDDEGALLTALEHLHRSGVSVTALATRLCSSPRRRLLGVDGLRRLSALLDDAVIDDDETDELRARVAALAEELGEHEIALRRWSECTSVGDTTVAIRARLGASDAAMALGRRHEAWSHWNDARRRCAGDSALTVESEAHRAGLEWFLEHRAADARGSAEVALAAARRLVPESNEAGGLAIPVRRALLRALGAATDSALNIGDVGAVLTFADERARLAARFDERVRIRALVDGALALRLQGRNGEALARLRPVWDQARRDILPQATLEVGIMLGTALRSAGLLAEAQDVTCECLALGSRLVEFGPARALTVVLPNLLELSRGDWRRGIDGLRRSAEDEPDPHYRLNAHIERAAALAYLEPAAGGEEVRAAADRARADAEQARCGRCLVEVTARGAEALARVGDVVAARTMLAQCQAHPTDLYDRFCIRRAHAALAVADGEDEAITTVESVIDDAERHGLHLEALWSRLELGSLLFDRDRHRAVETVRSAGATAELMGARTEQRLAERLLRSVGMRTWRRGSRSTEPGLAVLSGREREVAQMVSAGASNPEIAAALFLSRKTIERHVSNILAKLGLRNRAELAGYTAELPHETPSS